MSFSESIAKVLKIGFSQLMVGVGYTLLIALVATIIGLLIGLLLGIVRTIPRSRNGFIRFLLNIVNAVLSVYVEVFRGTPMMVQAMVIYWGYAFATNGQTLPLIPSAIFIVSINTGAYMAEIVRGGIISIDKGQFEGAQSVGMNHFQTMIHVVLPQVLRNILPAISNEFIINIKDTSVLNVIGVMELFYQATVISKITWEIFATYAVISVLYLIMTFSISRLLRLFERLLEGKNTYTIHGSQTDPAAEIKVNEGGTAV